MQTNELMDILPESGTHPYKNISPKVRTAAIGLIIKILEDNTDSFSDYYIYCPDNEKDHVNEKNIVLFTDALAIFNDYIANQLSIDSNILSKNKQ